MAMRRLAEGLVRDLARTCTSIAHFEDSRSDEEIGRGAGSRFGQDVRDYCAYRGLEGR